MGRPPRRVTTKRVTVRLATIMLAWPLASVPPTVAGGLQRCIVDGEVLFTDTACPDATRGEAVTVETPMLGNLEDAARVQQEADGLWLYKRDAADGNDPRVTKAASNPPARPQSLDILNAIRRRQVLDGMTPDEVTRAWGPPTSTSSRSDGGSAWTYRGQDQDGTFHRRTIRFQDGQVRGWTGTETKGRGRFDPDQGRWLD